MSHVKLSGWKQAMRTVCLLLGSWLILAAGCRTLQTNPADDPEVVAVAGSEVIDLATFENQYARSVGNRLEAADDSLQAYQDFLERYVNYRLRVQEARARGYDRDSAIVAEASAYRIELARNYLMRQEVIEPLLRTLYKRMPDMVDISHIFVRVPPDASPEDTLAAYRRLQALIDSVRQAPISTRSPSGTRTIRRLNRPALPEAAGGTSAGSKWARRSSPWKPMHSTRPSGNCRPSFGHATATTY